MGQTPPEWPSFSYPSSYVEKQKAGISSEAMAYAGAASLLSGWGIIQDVVSNTGVALVFAFQPIAG